MEKKYYQIATQTPEDWSIVHELLMKDGTLEDNIPSRSVECANEILHSPTRSTYLMTDEEAETLRNNSRILCINLDPSYHEDAFVLPEPYILKYGRNVRNYRSLISNVAPPTPTSAIPLNNYDGRSSGEFYRTGYQIRRCAQKDNPWTSNSSTVLNQDVDYLYDGSDIDVVVVDDGCFFGHPEFTWDEYSPPNYIRGNVLNRSGLCGVLDLVLDGPYYLDQAWFDANPTARLERRWDGTFVPVESVARNWWGNPSQRSPSFPNFGSIFIPDTYTRAANNGRNRTIPPSNLSRGSHGTACAGLAYGKNFGWAFNANKWLITMLLAGGSGGIGANKCFDVQKVFHLYKPINPKFGTKNPTISSNSWGVSFPVGAFTGVYRYQTGDAVPVGPGNPYTSLDQVPFLKTRMRSNKYEYFQDLSSSTPGFIANSDVIAGKELVDSGVIFCAAGGNSGRYLASPTDPNFNNYYASGGETYYVNRPGYPAQIGYNNGEDSYKTFVIGAIDDEYTGAYSLIPETSPEYLSAGPGKERIARYAWLGVSGTPPADYTTRGTGIDFYAPADGTLSASSDISTGTSDIPTTFQLSGIVPLLSQNPYQISSSSGKFNDEYFSGTSSACPVFAGLAACFMQNNRGLSALELKTYLKSNIQNQTNFFLGPTPTSATDDRWHTVPYSTMGTPVKLIYQFAATTTTPNPTFTPTYGILSSSAVNERFTITHNTGLRNTLGIYGIQMFSSTISSGTSITLEIRNGYYLVGSANRVDAATGSPARDSDGTTFGNLDEVVIRVDPTNNKKVQLSDSDGRDSWDDMEITVQNGTFQKVGTQVYYVFTGGSLASFPSPSTPLPPTPTVTPIIPLGTYYVPPPGGGGTPPGSGAIVGGGNMSISGDIVAGGNITGLVSDERLKTNQKEIDNALEKLEKLNGFTYNFNDIAEAIGFDKNKRHSGVSAQDVNEVLPEAVAPAPADNDYLTVKYDKLIPLLIEAVKDLKNDIDEIKDNDNK